MLLPAALTERMKVAAANKGVGFHAFLFEVMDGESHRQSFIVRELTVHSLCRCPSPALPALQAAW